MRAAAASDIHGDEFFEPFARALKDLPEVDLFLLAGDITDKSRVEGFDFVLKAVLDRVPAEFVAVFGNNEYPADQAELAKRTRTRFLTEAAHVVEVRGERLRIVGTTGTLDEPTWWQRRNLPGIDREYSQRVEAVDRLLQSPEPTILLTHYPPTHATMGGEKEVWRAQLGSLRMEAVGQRRAGGPGGRRARARPRPPPPPPGHQGDHPARVVGRRAVPLRD